MNLIRVITLAQAQYSHGTTCAVNGGVYACGRVLWLKRAGLTRILVKVHCVEGPQLSPSLHEK